MHTATTHPTSTPGSIVVGVDGSEDSRLALDWAARQADLEGRVLTILHGTGLQDPFWTSPAMIGLDRFVADRDAQAQGVLDEAAGWARASHPDLVIEQVRTPVDPRQALLAAGEGAAMVVVGSHGRGPVRSLLLGSVGVAVLQLASCPVVVLRPPDGTRPSHGVLVGTDGTSTTRSVVEFAFRLASARSWPLTVLECYFNVRLGSDQPGDGRDAGSAEDHRSGLTATVEALSAAYPDVEVETRLDQGFLHQRLVDLSTSMNVVVVGARRTGPLQRLVYGSLAPTVVEHATGTVAVVPIGSETADVVDAVVGVDALAHHR